MSGRSQLDMCAARQSRRSWRNFVESLHPPFLEQSRKLQIAYSWLLPLRHSTVQYSSQHNLFLHHVVRKQSEIRVRKLLPFTNYHLQSSPSSASSTPAACCLPRRKKEGRPTGSPPPFSNTRSNGGMSNHTS